MIECSQTSYHIIHDATLTFRQPIRSIHMPWKNPCLNPSAFEHQYTELGAASRIDCTDDWPLSIRLQLGLGACGFRRCFRCRPRRPRRAMDLRGRITDFNALVRGIWRFLEILKNLGRSIPSNPISARCSNLGQSLGIDCIICPAILLR
jgi:hypothetical protein